MAGIVLAILMVTAEIGARGRGGGGRGGFSRGGGARMGSISRGGSMDRPSRRPVGGTDNRDVDRGQIGNRGDRRPDDFGDRGSRDLDRDRLDPSENRRVDRDDDRHDAIKDHRDDVRDRRKDRRDEVREYHEYWRDPHIYVGYVVPSAAFYSYSCTRTTVVSSGVTYTECGSYWYQRRYAGGSVTYVVVDAPPGH
jgi:hypothetical protein